MKKILATLALVLALAAVSCRNEAERAVAEFEELAVDYLEAAYLENETRKAEVKEQLMQCYDRIDRIDPDKFNQELIDRLMVTYIQIQAAADITDERRKRQQQEQDETPAAE